MSNSKKIKAKNLNESESNIIIKELKDNPHKLVSGMSQSRIMRIALSYFRIIITLECVVV